MGIQSFKRMLQTRTAASSVKALGVAAVFSVIGVLVIQSSSASTFVASQEAETGAVAGLAAAVDDGTASGGRVVRFGQGGAATGWPTTPPAQICGNQAILGNGPTSAPAGAVTVPAGNNSGVNFSQPNTTYWFAPGVHTLGTDLYDQIIPGAGSKYIGAPGAIIDGQNRNLYAFTQPIQNVTIQYLTIRNFGRGLDNNNEGTVNHDSGDGWRVEYSTLENNDGAALMMGKDNVYRYNCIKNNGQYAINAFRCRDYGDFPDSCGGSITNVVVDHNEIVGNNQDDWETRIDGCGCTGGIKFWDVSNAQVTNNWVRNNLSVGIWLDNNNRGFLIENNYVEGNSDEALWMEAGYDAKVVNNTFKNNTWQKGRSFVGNSFVIGTIYVSENGSDPALNPKYFPLTIASNLFENNWGGVALWENADRYCASPAHTHGDYCTLYFGNGYDPGPCTQPRIGSLADKYQCRWSTQNLLIENNEFRINKATIGQGCSGANWCGKSAIFSNYGTFPSWSPFMGFEIADRIVFNQNNVFRNNKYFGDWRFKIRDQGSNDITWNQWRASPYNQDAGSTLTP